MQDPAHPTQAGQTGRPEEEILMKALSAPFDPSEVRFKPAVVSGNRALALAYVDARVIQDRLDEVLGVTGWQDDYECLPDGSVVCRLRIRVGDEWLTRVDVGGPSEQPDGGDRLKAAFSDALKRAAVKFGIGRYLYRLPSQWVDYDAHKRQFVKTPTLPAYALPPKKAPAPAAKPQAPAAAAKPPAAPRATTNLAGHALPANGEELQRRLYDYDSRLARQGLCQQGDLVKHVVQAGVKAGHDSDLATWSGPAIALAVEQTKAFEAQLRQRPREAKKEVA
jgi:pyruvate/2-oxoglutarate dehydrogenase complex dihydrolipoamide acyltransferase (E2) component